MSAVDILNNVNMFGIETNNSKICKVGETSLHITGFYPVTQYEKLQESKINIVINVSEEDHSDETKQFWFNEKINYHFIPIKHDRPSQLIIEQCKQIKEIIDSNKDKQIVVHCTAGISRSVSTVIFYLMSISNKTYEQCLELIQKTRYMADPNDGFEKQLKKYYFNVEMCKLLNNSK